MKAPTDFELAALPLSQVPRRIARFRSLERLCEAFPAVASGYEVFVLQNAIQTLTERLENEYESAA